MASDWLVLLRFECLSFCLFCLWVHTESRSMPTESGLSLQPPGLFLCLVFPLWLVHRGGGKGTACVPLSCSSSQSAALRGEGQCAGLLRELQLQVSDCEWCSHHRQPCPTVCSRCCGPLRHSDGRQEQQQDCFASSFMDPVTMLARVGMNLCIRIFIL